MNLEATPSMLPGACFHCNVGKEGRSWFIDMGYVEGYGVLYICNDCFNEASGLTGTFIRFDELSALRQNLTDLKEELEAWEDLSGYLTSRGFDLHVVAGWLRNSSVPGILEVPRRSISDDFNRSDQSVGVSNDSRLSGVIVGHPSI